MDVVDLHLLRNPAVDLQPERGQTVHHIPDHVRFSIETDQQFFRAQQIAGSTEHTPREVAGLDRRVYLSGCRDALVYADQAFVQAQLQMLVLQSESHDEVTLTVLRDGEELQLDVTLGERSVP